MKKTTSPAPLSLSPDDPLVVKVHQALPVSLVLQALQETDKDNKRLARLPAAAVVVLLVLAGLFRHISLAVLLRFTGLSRPKKGQEELASGTLTAARKRLGTAPFHHLLKETASRESPQGTPRDFYGLRCFALDGSKARVADSPENRVHFGGHRGKNGNSAYPLMRVVVVLDLASRLLFSARVGAFSIAEQVLGLPLLTSLPPSSLLLLDKGFFSMVWLVQLHRMGGERCVLLPLRKGSIYRVVHKLGPGDELVEFKLSDKAKRHLKDPPATFQMRVLTIHLPGWRPMRLGTTMMAPKKYPRHAIAREYLQRWEVELALAELKTTQLQRMEALRSRLPELCEQELLAVMVGYNVVRQQMVVRAERQQAAPNRISFVRELECVRWQWIGLLMADPEVRRKLEEGGEGWLLPPRREGRRCVRAVKLGRSGFPSKGPRRSRAETHARTVEEIDKKAA